MGPIRAPDVPRQTGPIRFSFRYVDLKHAKFRVDHTQKHYVTKLIERFKALCELRVTDALNNHSTALRCHPIHWPDTSEPEGFAHLNEQLQGHPAYQFSVSSNKYGRVHGFLLEDTFFVVWLDQGHRLYP